MKASSVGAGVIAVLALHAFQGQPQPAPPSIRSDRSLSLIVLTREHGGFHDLDIPAAQQEAERLDNQKHLAALSKRGEQRIVASGEDMQLEAPQAVVQAIQDVLSMARTLATPANRTDKPN